jgi:phytanoyl-CoA hydroxylase
MSTSFVDRPPVAAEYARYKADYDRDGFAIVRSFLPPTELAELTENLDRYIRDIVPTLSDAHAFYHERGRPETLKQMQHMGIDPYFAAYKTHPRWTALASAVIGEPAAGEEPEWFNKPAGTVHVTPPHQDNYYFCLKPPHVCTIWLALERVDNENGCLRYVSGSHLAGVRPHGSSGVLGFSQGIVDYSHADREREVPIHLAPGDAVVHHGNTIHRADANRSATRGRRAFAMVCKGESCRRDEEAFARYQEALKSQHQAMGLKT